MQLYQERRNWRTAWLEKVTTCDVATWEVGLQSAVSVTRVSSSDTPHRDAKHTRQGLRRKLFLCLNPTSSGQCHVTNIQSLLLTTPECEGTHSSPHSCVYTDAATGVMSSCSATIAACIALNTPSSLWAADTVSETLHSDNNSLPATATPVYRTRPFCPDIVTVDERVQRSTSHCHTSARTSTLPESMIVFRRWAMVSTVMFAKCSRTVVLESSCQRE